MVNYESYLKWLSRANARGILKLWFFEKPSKWIPIDVVKSHVV